MTQDAKERSSFTEMKEKNYDKLELHVTRLLSIIVKMNRAKDGGEKKKHI